MLKLRLRRPFLYRFFSSVNHYETLELPSGCTQKDIKVTLCMLRLPIAGLPKYTILISTKAQTKTDSPIYKKLTKLSKVQKQEKHMIITSSQIHKMMDKINSNLNKKMNILNLHKKMKRIMLTYIHLPSIKKYFLKRISRKIFRNLCLKIWKLVLRK
jgi:hypothetical protein